MYFDLNVVFSNRLVYLLLKEFFLQVSVHSYTHPTAPYTETNWLHPPDKQLPHPGVLEYQFQEQAKVFDKMTKLYDCMNQWLQLWIMNKTQNDSEWTNCIVLKWSYIKFNNVVLYS